MTKKPLTVGVIVGRFQVPELHTGHRRLIDFVCERHAAVFIVLASSGGAPTPRNPLPFLVREAMILEAYPHDKHKIKIDEIMDHPISPAYWSAELDALIESEYPGYYCVLYGSRDSFLDVYSGKLGTHRVQTGSAHESGSNIRARTEYPTTAEGRAALIWRERTRFPVAYRTVDLAIVDFNKQETLCIRKNRHEGFCSFMGGHVEPFETDAEAVIREREEEIPGITHGPPKYLASLPVDDPRYRGTTDGMTTSFYYAAFLSGEPRAGDDADAVEWVRNDALTTRLVPWHRPLGELLLKELRP